MILAASVFRFGIVVAAVDYREIFIFCNAEAGWSDTFGEKVFAEFGAIGVEHETERATEEDAGRFERCDERGEAELNAADDIVPDVWIGDFGDEMAVFFIDGAGGGNILPFEFLVSPDIFGVTGFEI